MGCCESKVKLTEKNITIMVKECIEKNNYRLASRLLNDPSFSLDKDSVVRNLDGVIVSIHSLKLNSLAYALFLGRLSLFSQIHKFGCSLSTMEFLLSSQNLPAITLICSKGYSDLLSYYLPYYIETHSNDKPEEKTFTIDFHLDLDLKPSDKSKYTAAHLAVQYNHISIITVLTEYFKSDSLVPFELDLEYQDSLTGENCALIACRFGSYPMVKFLHQKCAANFMVINKLGENALQIAIDGSRKKPHLQYHQIIVYLVDIVGIDVRYNYEDSLLMADDPEIIQYIEKKLRYSGIIAKKIEITEAVLSPLRVDNEEIIEQVEDTRKSIMGMYIVSCSERSESVASSNFNRELAESLLGSTLSEFHK